ncbi:aerobic carbon-monoxide dehydrogenase large subunit [uncultured Gammaproteobacteria bacterium]
MMIKFGIGQSVPRTEDARLLTGHGRFTEDLSFPSQAHAVVLRSPHAHADITRLDTTAARAAPDVLAVFTAQDLAADGIGALTCQIEVPCRDGRKMAKPRRPVLAEGRVRYVGEAVAFVVAETVNAARDAAELIEVDYRPLAVAADTAGALAPAAAQVWPAPQGNLCFDWEMGDAATVAEVFAAAAHVVGLDLVNNRVIPCAMENRAALARLEPDSDRLVLHVTSQGVHALRKQLAKEIFHIPESQLRVITGDVGGGFGAKIFLYPEYVLTLYAARKLKRPIKWRAERSESFLADSHGRDHVTRAELALDRDGRFLALRADTIANLGAYLSSFAPAIPTLAGSPLLAGVYTTPAIYARVRGVFTNTAPVDAYRGAGRPEAAFVVERLVDVAARRLGLNPAEIRRRNLIPASAMPYRTPTGKTYDSGDFARTLDQALIAADVVGFAARRVEAAGRGRRRGLGLACYIEACAGGSPEQATVRVAADGRVEVLIGTQSSGQGHETAYAQIIAERFGLAADAIEVVQGDTDRVAWGMGTDGSRSGPIGGAALAQAAGKVLDAARFRAAVLLDAEVEAVRFADGLFIATGTNHSVTWAEVAAAAVIDNDQPGPAFEEVARWKPPAATFPNGSHVCEVEIDPETGAITIPRYTVVDDFGTMINPLLVAGQVHGGVAQGIGQALHERCVYDSDNGQLLTGSFSDYGPPRAEDLPSISLSFAPTRCPTNALGMKGAGEAGAIGAPPAVINAVVDALANWRADWGVTHVDMPATPERVWRLIGDFLGASPPNP